MTAADNAHLIKLAASLANRGPLELGRALRRAHDWRQPTAAGHEVRSTTVSDPTCAAALAAADATRRPDPMTTLEPELLAAVSVASRSIDRLLTLLDRAVTIEAAYQAQRTETETVDGINGKGAGYCEICESGVYCHGDRSDRRRLVHAELWGCESCRSAWRRVLARLIADPSDHTTHDNAWRDFVPHRRQRAAAGITDLNEAS